ncbi:spermatogenesis-associated protein 7-like isoform X2 [Rhea pennata]|uniref:spermatogenesis-associated protein 7-like isoform X2 n=1 Tax=Rhea pennata TaxID=8795 RepID=UPI002E26D821
MKQERVLARVAMMPTYSMMGPFKGHMSLKSSPFSPGSSCKLSNQYIIQDHMAAHYRKLMSAKAAVDLSAPKSLHTSVKYNDQQKRDRLIQALENYKKDHVRSLSASPFTSRSVSPGQQKRSRSLLAKSHLYLQFGQNNCSLTKREQPPFVPFQKLPSRTLSPAFTARKTIQNPAQDVLSETHVHEANTGRLSASPLRPSHIRVSSCSRKKTFQNSFNKTYSGDLLDKHSVCFTEKKHFTPRILKRSHQSVLVKHRYYNPPHKKKNLSPGRPSLKSVDVDSEKKGDLRSFLEDALVRPQLNHFCEKPVENYELWFTDSDMSLSPRSQLQEKADYFCFLEDLTNDILIRRCYHKAALEDVFQTHIKSKRHNLDEVKMRRIVQSLKKELNITKQPDLPISCNSRQNDASIAATCF